MSLKDVVYGSTNGVNCGNLFEPILNWFLINFLACFIPILSLSNFAKLMQINTYVNKLSIPKINSIMWREKELENKIIIIIIIQMEKPDLVAVNFLSEWAF